jgi:replicative DNA helicase
MEKLKEDRIITSFEMKEELAFKPDAEYRLLSNMPTLDRATGGFVEGELIVVSGPTKHGKTLFAQSLTGEFVKQNAFPLWFSFEVMPKYFLAAFPELPLFYMPRRLQMNALGWVTGKMLEALKEYGTRVVFIDHLHYLIDLARLQNASIEVGTVIRRLKTTAVQNGLIIFLLCHTKKGATERDISHDDIRDSSFVAQESDCVMMITRNLKRPESNEAKLFVEFHRRTGALHQVVDLVKVNGFLKERSPRAYDDPDARTGG